MELSQPPPVPKARRKVTLIPEIIPEEPGTSSDDDLEIVIVEGNDVIDSPASPTVPFRVEEELDSLSSPSSEEADVDESVPRRSLRNRQSPARYKDYVLPQTSTSSVVQCPTTVLALLLSDDFIGLLFEQRKSLSSVLKSTFGF
ncbi:hypothetical protein SNE40_009667 [Patella caerulea]|uniref:Uncharacterized protein n=1 Tax=Patella caerulea TaxID=87958 RepID=A0AAN8PS61_PATCE